MENKGSNKVICLYKDKKANLYTAPMLFDNEQCALRHFDNIANKDINVCDYDLYFIGYYNDVFGSIELLQNGEHYLLRAGDYYYEHITKLKDFVGRFNEYQEKNRLEYRKMLDFAKTLYKELHGSYDEESFCILSGDFDEKYDKDNFKVGDYIVKK